MNNRGPSAYVTVYLALSLGIIIAMITTMLYGARIQTIRFQTECAMDLSLNSLLAEYNREMLEQYKLFFIDCGYGDSGGSRDRTKSHLLHYMNENFDSDSVLLNTKNLTACRADNAIINEVSYGSDNSGQVLRYEIDRYMKTISGIDLVSDSLDSTADLQSYLDDYDSYCAERESSEEQVDEILDELNSELEEDEEPYSISNPADAVESLTPGTALYYAIQDSGSLRLRKADLSQYISHRSYDNGVGLRAYQESPDGIMSRELFYRYIFSQCGYYRDEKEDSGLTYQLEYLIEGEDSDLDNMEEIADTIFKTRYAINMAYLLSSGSKQAEAEELAVAATSAVMQPELAEAVKMTILFAWGYAESAKDMRILYDGNKLTLVKSDDTWNTPLTEMVDFAAFLGNYSAPEGQMDYETYLNLFIRSKSIDTITMRLMDLMEMDIRMTPGNQYFRMDRAIYQFYGEVNVSSNYGYACSIRRFATYE